MTMISRIRADLFGSETAAAKQHVTIQGLAWQAVRAGQVRQRNRASEQSEREERKESAKRAQTRREPNFKKR